MESKLVFPDQCYREYGARKNGQVYIKFDTSCTKKYCCQICWSKNHFASKYRKLQQSSVITEYEKGESKDEHGLKAVKAFNEGLSL